MNALDARSHAPFTGFGDDPNASVKFTINQPGRTFPLWVSSPVESRHRIANSNRVVTQTHGRDPWRITLPLEFATIDDYELMDALIGERATLRYLAGLTNRAGGETETILGTPYLALPETRLVSLGNPVSEGVLGGTCEATATFERTYVPASAPVFGPWPEPPFPFPIPVSLLLPLDGDLDGWDADGEEITASGSGALRWVETDIDGVSAAWVEEETTNLNPNPVFDADIAGWGNFGIVGDITASVGHHSGPPTAARWTITSSSEAGILSLGRDTGAGAFAPGDPCTVSATVVTQGVTGSVRLRIWPHDAGGTPIGAPSEQSLVMAVDGEPLELVHTLASCPASTSGLYVYVDTFLANAHGAATSDALQIQIEKRAYATTFCPQFDDLDTLLDGYAWNSTPHASTSTRTAAAVWDDPDALGINTATGELIVRAMIPALTGTHTVWWMGDHDTDDTMLAVQVLSTGAVRLQASRNGETAVTGTTAAGVVSPGVPFVARTSWSADEAVMQIDDVTPVAIARPAPMASWGSSLDVGSLHGTADWLNGWAHALPVFSRLLTAAERARAISLIQSAALDISMFG